MIKVDLPEQIVSFITQTGHKYIDNNGKTYICNNPFWYNYQKAEGEDPSYWAVLEPNDFPEGLKADYIEYLEDFLSKLKGEHINVEISGVPEV